MIDKRYTGTPETVLSIMQVAYGPHGAKSWMVRKYVENVIKDVRSRDYWSEALAVYYDACSPHVRYTHDPEKIELVKSPEKMIYEIQTRGVTLGDCDDLTALLLAELSLIGVQTRIGTGGFIYDPDIWPLLGLERPERFGFSMSGDGYAGGPFTHVWPEGKRPDGVWVVLDPVAGPATKQMRRRLRQVRYYSMK